MTPAEIAQVRHELSLCRKQVDDALGTSMLLLSRLERAWRDDEERGRVVRLTRSELSTLGEEGEAST